MIRGSASCKRPPYTSKYDTATYFRHVCIQRGLLSHVYTFLVWYMAVALTSVYCRSILNCVMVS